MSDYLKNLQESVMLTESFKRVREEITLTEEELREEFSGILTEEELSEIEVGTAWNQIFMRLTKEEAVVGGALAAAAIIAFAVKAAARFTSNPECKKYSGGTMKKCNTIMKLKKKASAMNAKKTLCQKSKDPKSCTAKVNAKIQDIQDKLKTLGPISGTD
jgi:hypothetical protein